VELTTWIFIGTFRAEISACVAVTNYLDHAWEKAAPIMTTAFAYIQDVLRSLPHFASKCSEVLGGFQPAGFWGVEFDCDYLRQDSRLDD